jgi:F-type H+-transporting ATPase subunit alpha
MNVVDQVMAIFAGTRGFLDKIERKHVLAWQDQFLQFMRDQRRDVRAELVKRRSLDEKKDADLVAKLKSAIEAFQPQFKA